MFPTCSRQVSNTLRLMSYPKPTTSVKVQSLPHELQPLRPLCRPPVETFPSLPERPQPDPIAGFTYSTHVASAAYPRSIRHGTGSLRRESEPYGNIQGHIGGSKEDKKAAVERAISTSYRYNWEPEQTSDDESQWDRGLYMAVERWKRVEPVRGGRSLVLTHANGFNKECWHPILRSLLADPNIPINEVWGLDAVNHGASVDLNAGRLGPGNVWRDNGRDVLAFIQHAMPEPGASAGTELKWHPAQKRSVIGAGHSYGGNGLVRAAVQFPELFESLFLVEPMMRPLVNPSDVAYAKMLLTGALRRRSHWPSKEQAASSLLQSPFFKVWDPEVFQTYLNYGLVPHKDGVQLATPNWCEAQVFGTDWGLHEGWEILPALKTRAHFVMAGNALQTGGEQVTQHIVWRAPNSSNERIMSAGHLILHEKPDLLTEAMARFLIAQTQAKAKL